MKKRILSMILAIVMVVGMMPGVTLTAFAAEGDVASITVGETVTYYTSFDSAVDAAAALTEEATLTVLRDVAVTQWSDKLWSKTSVAMVVNDGVTVTLSGNTTCLYLGGGLGGTGTITGDGCILVRGDVENITVSAELRLNGTIRSGIFTKKVLAYANSSTIAGGTFSGSVQMEEGEIAGGTFNCPVESRCTRPGGTCAITGGIFNDTVTNDGGSVTGGTFNGKLENSANSVPGAAVGEMTIITGKITNTATPTTFTLGENFSIENEGGMIECTSHIITDGTCRLCGASDGSGSTTPPEQTDPDTPSECTHTPELNVVTHSGGFNAAEGAESLFDGNPGTKWCSDASYHYVEFSYDMPVQLQSDTLTPGGDTAEYKNRNWKGWTIEGRNAVSEAWTVVDKRVNQELPYSGTSDAYTITGLPLYSQYRLTVDEYGESAKEDVQQMADLNLTVKCEHQSTVGNAYAVTVAESENGTVNAQPTTAYEGQQVVLTVTPDDGYELDSLTVKQGDNEIKVENNSFIMPAGAVTVTASFKENVVPEAPDDIDDFCADGCASIVCEIDGCLDSFFSYFERDYVVVSKVYKSDGEYYVDITWRVKDYINRLLELIIYINYGEHTVVGDLPAEETFTAKWNSEEEKWEYVESGYKTYYITCATEPVAPEKPDEYDDFKDYPAVWRCVVKDENNNLPSVALSFYNEAYSVAGEVYECDGEYFCDITWNIKEYWEEKDEAYINNYFGSNFVKCGENHQPVEDLPEAKVFTAKWNVEKKKWEYTDKVDFFVTCETEPAQAAWGASADSLTGSGTLAEAFAAAMADGSTVRYIRLESDITTTGDFEIKDCIFTLDLNGKTWSLTENAVSMESNTDIKVTDSSSEKTGTIQTDDYDLFSFKGNPKLEIAGGTLRSSSQVVGTSWAGNKTDGILIISGGTLNTENSRIVYVYCDSVTVTGGTFEFDTSQTNLCHFYYRSGTLDLSGYSDPEDLIIYVSTDACPLALSESTINLPDGYALYGKDGIAVDEIQKEGYYTVGRTTYSVEVPEVDGADVEVTPTEPKAGDKVTITVDPDEGKEIVDVTVTDEDDNKIEVTDNGGGTYTYEQPDGDVTVEVELKTKEYTVTFYGYVNGAWYNMIGEPQTVKHGEAAVAPEPPVCVGYTFGGWNTFFDKVTADTEVRAVYYINSHLVQFLDWNGNVLKSVDVLYDNPIYSPEDPAREGYTFTGWLDESGNLATLPMIMPDNPITFTAQYSVNQYTITFVDTGDAAYAPITQDYGTDVAPLADPVKTGYTFAGWDVAIPATMPADNLTITAQWTVNNYTVKWIVDGAETTETYAYGAAVTAPADPTKTGYTFAGWGASVPATMPAENLTFTAQWTVNNYTVKWIVDGAETTETYAYGAAVTAPADPTKTGYTFAGWGASVPATMPAENLTFTAQWTVNVYRIIYNLDGGKIEVEYPTTYTYGVAEQLPVTARKFTYLFRGWLNEDGEVITEIPAGTVGDVEVTAKWVLNPMVLLPFLGDSDPENCARGNSCPLCDFSDLDPKAWYHDGIHFALAEGIMNGTGDNTFSPNAATSRAMVVTILYRMEGSPAASVQKAFSDVSYDTWYGAAVNWAAANGIVEGYEDGTFRPNTAITREQMAAILYRYAAYKGDWTVDYYTESVVSGYPDAASVSGYAVKAVNWAVAEGLINGMDGALNPRGTATRAQAAAILYRYLAK